MRNQVLITIFLFFLFTKTEAQIKKQLELNLKEVISIANKNSLDAFRDKNMYLKSYFDFKNFKTEKLPTINFNVNPLNYNRSLVERYNQVENRDEYRENQSFNSSVGFNLEQKILATGGSISLSSNLNRLENISDTRFINFNNNLFKIGFSQSFFSFNTYKWQKKIAPLAFETAKSEYIQSQQTINLKAVEIFFFLSFAQLNYDTSLNNFENAKKLYEYGERKYQLSIISQEELFKLKLNVINMEISLNEDKLELVKNKNELKLFLKFDDDLDILPITNKNTPIISLQKDYVIKQVLSNNPDLMNSELNKIRSMSNIDKAKLEKKTKVYASGSYGLNKNGVTFSDSYVDPLDQYQLSIGLSIPVIDWGRRKRNVKIAQKEYELTIATNKQIEKELLNEIDVLINNINNQNHFIKITLEASELADKLYKIALQKYKSKTIDLFKVQEALLNKDLTKNKYLKYLRDYWINYYSLQKVALINPETLKKIDFNFINN